MEEVDPAKLQRKVKKKVLVPTKVKVRDGGPSTLTFCIRLLFFVCDFVFVCEFVYFLCEFVYCM